MSQGKTSQILTTEASLEGVASFSKGVPKSILLDLPCFFSFLSFILLSGVPAVLGTGLGTSDEALLRVWPSTSSSEGGNFRSVVRVRARWFRKSLLRVSLTEDLTPGLILGEVGEGSRECLAARAEADSAFLSRRGTGDDS